MKLYIFGSCSGTEPMENRHHTALAFEINDRIYWFDAGEGCSYTAHLMGVDLLKVSDIFISHPHMDHIGGLSNLLWNIRKLSGRRSALPEYGNVTVYTPMGKTFDSVLSLLKNSEGNYENAYETLNKPVTDGVVFKNDDVEVTALHNLHLPKKDDKWQSYSYLIKGEGKKIVFSGDVKSLDDLSLLLKDGCDLLLMETGHHTAEEVLKKIKDDNYNINKVYFIHHGRGILNDYEGTLKRCLEINPSVKICNDKDIYEI